MTEFMAILIAETDLCPQVPGCGSRGLDSALSEIREMIYRERDNQKGLIDSMPDTATTEVQKQLQERHGTPKEFAEACIDAIGEISVSEAQDAIMRYRKQWDASELEQLCPRCDGNGWYAVSVGEGIGSEQEQCEQCLGAGRL